MRSRCCCLDQWRALSTHMVLFVRTLACRQVIFCADAWSAVLTMEVIVLSIVVELVFVTELS